MSSMVDRRLVVTVAAALTVAACGESVGGGGDGLVGATHVVIDSDQPRDLDPTISAADMAALVAARNQFATEIYHQFRAAGDGNFVYSPISIAAAVARAYAGAERDSESQLAETLQFGLPEPTLHAGFNALDLALTDPGKSYKWRSVQTLWAQIGVPYLVDYLDLIAVYYGGDIHLVDFVGDPVGTAEVINQWIAEATAGEVGDIVEPGAITSPALLVANAVVANAEWREPFATEATFAGTFNLRDGGTTTVSMMPSEHSDVYRYANGDDYQALELAFAGDELTMVAILPDAGRFTAVEELVDGDFVSGLFANLAPSDLSVTLPRWSTGSRLDLSGLLEEMGAPAPFSPAADFSGVTGNRDLHMGGLAHRATIEVNEIGINAAASSINSSDVLTIRLVFDRPFIYLIRDVASGAILFAGRVMNPAAT